MGGLVGEFGSGKSIRKLRREMQIVFQDPYSSLDPDDLRHIVAEPLIVHSVGAHDLAVVRSMSDRIAVMQRGKIVEAGPAEDVYTSPSHDYTKTLLTSVPVPDPRAMRARKAERRRRVATPAGA
ncbi:MAG TPA: hypothetical protein VFT86_03305 [Gaiellaceae bacterium]|nr:hypothetical protein [Gaiellaceae bacterium]